MMESIPRAVRVLAAGLLGFVALIGWPVDHAQAALARVTGVTLQQTTGALQVSIATSGPARYQQRDVKPQWVVVDVLGAELGIPAGTLPQSGGQISRVRVGQFAPDIVRVVVELTGSVRVRLRPSSDGTAILIGIPARGTVGGETTGTATRLGSGRGGIARVTGITLWGTPSKPWVSITASGPVRYQRRNSGPDRVVLDVFKAELALSPGKPPTGRGLVKRIRAGQLDQDTVRVVVELLQPVPVHLALSADRAAIVVSLAPTAKRHDGFTQTQGDVAHQSEPSQPTATGAEPTAQPQPAGSGSPAVTALAAASSPPEASRASTSAAPSVVSLPAAPQNSARPAAGPYLLGPEDILEVTVWGYPDMTRVVTVRPDGQVAVPLAGTVPAAGRSVERLTQDVTRAYAKYIINPQVTVIVKEFRKIRISVLGQVTKPGAYTLPPGARVLDAISASSGVTDNAALTQVQLVRVSGDTQPLSLEGLLVQQDMHQNFVLEPGDTLIVPEDTKNKFYVLGDVNRPGIYPLKGDVTVLQALAIAGGPVIHGASTSTTAHIVRRVGPQQGPLTASVRAQDVQPIANGSGTLITMDLHKMYQGDLRQNQTLRPGDVMVVPAPGVAALPGILSIISTIFLGIR
jgi:polysaccharide export outer membrane protein